MDQIAHIFRKDVRHHWPWIVVSLAVVVAYGWKQATFGITPTTVELGMIVYGFLLGFLSPLVPIAWALLIVRVVHDECLVGDRQFWVTRPYEWRKLLAAKVLFVVAFVNVPLFVLQAFLLWRAGFPPSHYLGGLLWLELQWTLLLILPVATLVAVTAAVGQSILAVLAVLVYVVGIGVLSSALPNAAVAPTVFPLSIAPEALSALGVAVILRQYARRTTAQSRLALLFAAAAIPIVILATPYRTLIARAYPEAPPGLSVQLRFDPAKPTSHQRGYPEKNKAHVRIPLHVSGIAEGSAAFVHGTMVSVQALNGPQWRSDWRPTNLALMPEHPRAHLDITLDRDFFERVKEVPVKLEISLVLGRLRAKEITRVVAQPIGFALPGEGRCASSRGGISCLFPLKTPYLLISGRSDEMTCRLRENETPLPAGSVGYGLIGSAGSSPDFGISPVQSADLYLSDWGESGNGNSRGRSLCPGMPLTVFSAWEGYPRVRTDLNIENLRLIDYQLDDSLAGFGFSIAVP